MMKRILGAIAAGVVIGASVAVGYKVATDARLREELTSRVRGTLQRSKETVDGMSEDVAVKTAQVTRNSQITQDWVERQWDAVL